MIRGRKDIVVHVVAYRKKAGDSIQLVVTPEALDLTSYPRGRYVIRWQLDTLGYEFPKDGAAIEFTSPGWEEAYSAPKVSECGRYVTAQVKAADGLAFAYNVHVLEPKTNERAFLDPVIQNQMP